MVEVITDTTTQLFKDVLLNDACQNDEGMGKIASDYGIEVVACEGLVISMLMADSFIKSGSAIITDDQMKQVDLECYNDMTSSDIKTISVSLKEYDAIIDSIGLEKAASIFGDSVKFYDWYRKSNDSDLAILKDREDYSEDTVIDDENPFMEYEQPDNKL